MRWYCQDVFFSAWLAFPFSPRRPGLCVRHHPPTHQQHKQALGTFVAPYGGMECRMGGWAKKASSDERGKRDQHGTRGLGTTHHPPSALLRLVVQPAMPNFHLLPKPARGGERVAGWPWPKCSAYHGITQPEFGHECPQIARC